MLALIINVGLTVAAWFRGWKWRAIIPLSIGIVAEAILWLIMMFLFIGNFTEQHVIDFMGTILVGLIIDTVLNLGIIIPLVYMVVKGYQEEKPITQAPLAVPVYQAPAIPAPMPVPVNAAKLVLPDNSEISIRGAEKAIGRRDFERIILPDELRYVSRQHIVIQTDGCRYYIEDRNSSNKTKVNDVDITGRGRWKLKDGDRIKLADVITMQ
jgi:hypothetical protein